MGFFDFLKPKRTSQLSPELERQIRAINLSNFPRGENQIREESLQLHALLRGKLSKDEAKRLLLRTKSLITVAEDKSQERIVPSIIESTGGKLTAHEGTLAFQFFTGVSGPLFDGGDGSSEEEAVIINATSSISGIDAEYKWLGNVYGERDKDWTIEMRMHGDSGDGKSYETFVLNLADGKSETVVFDVSSFYGRF